MQVVQFDDYDKYNNNSNFNCDSGNNNNITSIAANIIYP